MATNVITIEDEAVVLAAKGADGDVRERKRVPLGRFLASLQRRIANPKGLVETPILPENVRYYASAGKKQVVVMEQQHGIRTLLWEDFDDPVELALPYVLYIFYFEDGEMPTYTSRLFFRNKPLTSLDDKLYFSFLTHINDGENRAVGGACFRNPHGEAFKGTIAQQIEQSLDYYWSTRFRDYWEGNPWRGCQAKNKEAHAMSGVKEWAEKTVEDPFFILSVNWADTGLTVKQVVGEMIGKPRVKGEGEDEVPALDIAGLANMITRIRQ